MYKEQKNKNFYLHDEEDDMCCEDLTKKMKDITLLIRGRKYIVVVTSIIDTPTMILNYSVWKNYVKL